MNKLYSAQSHPWLAFAFLLIIVASFGKPLTAHADRPHICVAAGTNSNSSEIQVTEWWGQTFTTTPSHDYILSGVEVNAYANNLVGATGTISIFAFDSFANTPTGNALQIQAIAYPNDAAAPPNDGGHDVVCTGGSYAVERYNFQPLKLAPFTQYVFVLKRTGTTTGDVILAKNNASDTYSGGHLIHSTNSGGSWSNVNYDTSFIVWEKDSTLTSVTSDQLYRLENRGISRDVGILLLFLLSCTLSFWGLGLARAPAIAYVGAFGFWGIFWIFSTLLTPLTIFFLTIAIAFGVIGSIMLVRGREAR